MRKLLALAFGMFFGIFQLAAYNFPGIEDVMGTWVNVNPNTRGITKLVITSRRGRVYVKAWGKCHPTDCAFGEKEAYAFGANPRRDPARHFKALLVIYRFRDSEKYFIINRPAGERLKLKILSRYPSDENKNAALSYIMKRAASIQPHRITQAPEPIFPPNGKVFTHFPRTTTLRWRPVPGAASYTVEIYYIEPCGPMRRIETCRAVLWKRVEGIRNTTYTFNFVGAQPGKWRVWAVDAQGRPGPKSPWMFFRYVR